MFLNPCPPISVSTGSRLRAAVFVCFLFCFFHLCTYIPIHHTLRSLLLFHYFSQSIYYRIAFQMVQKRRMLFVLVKPKRVKTCLRQGPSSGAPQERLRRPPLTSRGSTGVAASPRPPLHWQGPMYWHMKQPVHCPG